MTPSKYLPLNKFQVEGKINQIIENEHVQMFLLKMNKLLCILAIKQQLTVLFGVVTPLPS